MALFLFLIIGFISFINSRLKTKKPINISLIILIGLFFAFNRDNQDYEGYVKIFENVQAYAEPGYALLVNFIKSFDGGNYNNVLLVLGVFVSITFYKYFSNYKVASFALLCYFIFPMPIDIVQTRNTFLTFFLLSSLIEFSEKKYLKSGILLAIGSSFHYLGFIYIIPLLIVFFNKKKQYSKIVLFASVVFLILTPLLLDVIMSNVAGIRNTQHYLSKTSKIHSLLTWGSVLVLDLIIFNYFIKKIINHDSKTINLINTLYRFMLASLTLLGGLLILNEFNRVFRTLFIVKYLLCGAMLPYLSARNKIILGTYTLSTSILLGLFYASGLDYDYILFSNLLFSN
ncbi:EpsG family protein [uncultured Cocleimonas sp.]|uniref:EpsG family protein n=1 Tax=uncultured Cocleimonas sp. TaxID=1051587 RepID=UPI002622B6B0|nr:EpsG family protein [uncultured Cocleimonas sp.]